MSNKWVQKMSLTTTLQLHNLVQSKRNDHLIPKLIKLNTKLHLAEAWPEAGQKNVLWLSLSTLLLFCLRQGSQTRGPRRPYLQTTYRSEEV